MNELELLRAFYKATKNIVENLEDSPKSLLANLKDNIKWVEEQKETNKS